MFSLSKLLTLAAIIAAIWFGFRLIGRLDEARKRKVSQDPATGNPKTTAPGEDERGAGGNEVVDLVRDERTGEYVAPDNRDDRV